jgi:AraC family transcriptional regulator
MSLDARALAEEALVGARDAFEAEGDAVRVLVPLGSAALRVALPPPPGAGGSALLREPGICVLPPAARVEAALEAPGKLLVLVLQTADWRERAHAALGHVPEIRSVHAGPDAFVSRIAGMLDACREAAGECDGAWLAAIAEDLAIHLATRYGRPAEAPAHAGLAPHRLQRVLALIEERLDGPVPVQALAAAVHMSPYHFARMFKQSTGQPPHHYVTWQRMDRAKDLLARSELALAEIAARVGYRTQAHFTGVFHARVGVTPRAYRLRCRAGQV